jgi:hypothetical protein
MKNIQNFDIRLRQEEPSMFAPQWTREFEFILEIEEEENDTVTSSLPYRR